LANVFKEKEGLSAAFELMTQFKQREFCEYIDTAKREKTKHDRVNKIIPMILRGEGLGDKYRK